MYLPADNDILAYLNSSIYNQTDTIKISLRKVINQYHEMRLVPVNIMQKNSQTTTHNKLLNVRFNLTKDQDIINFLENSSYDNTTTLKLVIRLIIKQTNFEVSQQTASKPADKPTNAVKRKPSGTGKGVPNESKPSNHLDDEHTEKHENKRRLLNGFSGKQFSE